MLFVICDVMYEHVWSMLFPTSSDLLIRKLQELKQSEKQSIVSNSTTTNVLNNSSNI